MTTDAINLDGLVTSDLVRFIDDKSNDERLRNYAICIVEARRYRLTGDITNAQRWETRADLAYNAMPESLRW